MANPIAHAPHNGPVDQPGEGAYLYARSGIARSATTRSNYIAIQTAIDWIVRDGTGAIVFTADLSDVILKDSLHITQAINDEPDTCSFTLKPQTGAALLPQTGDEIQITWAPGTVPLFHGYVLVMQSDWRAKNRQPAWVSIQCQDTMWRFDARIVTYRFPAQSVTDSIAFLCNDDPDAAHAQDFSLAFVQAGMPSIPSFEVVNQRPSTVMRTLLSSVGGGFYLEGFMVHAWAGSASEPNRADPEPLTVDLKTLHAVRTTEDATQVRRRVLVEGKRSDTLISYPTVPTAQAVALGVAMADAAPFAGADRILRIGSQWMQGSNFASVLANGAAPPQTHTAAAYDPAVSSVLSLKQMPTAPPAFGWVRIGNQYARYGSYTGNPTTGTWQLQLAGPSAPYGRFTVPIPIDEVVEWVDGAANIASMGLDWRIYPPTQRADDPLDIRGQPVQSPVVVVAMAQDPPSHWPELEGFVQDGRYSYAGAQARATSDLAAFRDPLVSMEWETDDFNALPGRAQAMNLLLTGNPTPLTQTVTILQVDLSFPLRTRPPRRRCTGGVLKPSTFLDLVVTTQN
jgi:hypothetical protein